MKTRIYAAPAVKGLRAIVRVNLIFLAGSANCDENVWNYQDEDSGTCYLATSDKALSWQDARHNCILVGGDLPSLHTPEQVILIETMVKNTAAPGKSLYISGKGPSKSSYP